MITKNAGTNEKLNQCKDEAWHTPKLAMAFQKQCQKVQQCMDKLVRLSAQSEHCLPEAFDGKVFKDIQGEFDSCKSEQSDAAKPIKQTEKLVLLKV